MGVLLALGCLLLALGVRALLNHYCSRRRATIYVADTDAAGDPSGRVPTRAGSSWPPRPRMRTATAVEEEDDDEEEEEVEPAATAAAGPAKPKRVKPKGGKRPPLRHSLGPGQAACSMAAHLPREGAPSGDEAPAAERAWGGGFFGYEAEDAPPGEEGAPAPEWRWPGARTGEADRGAAIRCAYEMEEESDDGFVYEGGDFHDDDEAARLRRKLKASAEEYNTAGGAPGRGASAAGADGGGAGGTSSEQETLLEPGARRSNQKSPKRARSKGAKGRKKRPPKRTEACTYLPQWQRAVGGGTPPSSARPSSWRALLHSYRGSPLGIWGGGAGMGAGLMSSRGRSPCSQCFGPSRGASPRPVGRPYAAIGHAALRHPRSPYNPRDRGCSPAHSPSSPDSDTAADRPYSSRAFLSSPQLTERGASPRDGRVGLPQRSCGASYPLRPVSPPHSARSAPKPSKHTSSRRTKSARGTSPSRSPSPRPKAARQAARQAAAANTSPRRPRMADVAFSAHDHYLVQGRRAPLSPTAETRAAVSALATSGEQRSRSPTVVATRRPPPAPPAPSGGGWGSWLFAPQPCAPPVAPPSPTGSRWRHADGTPRALPAWMAKNIERSPRRQWESVIRQASVSRHVALSNADAKLLAQPAPKKKVELAATPSAADDQGGGSWFGSAFGSWQSPPPEPPPRATVSPSKPQPQDEAALANDRPFNESQRQSSSSSPRPRSPSRRSARTGGRES